MFYFYFSKLLDLLTFRPNIQELVQDIKPNTQTKDGFKLTIRLLIKKTSQYRLGETKKNVTKWPRFMIDEKICLNFLSFFLSTILLFCFTFKNIVVYILSIYFLKILLKNMFLTIQI